MEKCPRRKQRLELYRKKNVRLDHPAKIIYCAGSSNKRLKRLERFWKRFFRYFYPQKTNMAIWYTSLGGGNLNIFWHFHADLFGEDEPILTSIFFKWGWFNHRPDHQKRAPALTQSTESLEGSNDALHRRRNGRHFRRNPCSFLKKCYLEIQLLWWFFDALKKHSTIQNLYWSDVPPHFWYTSIEI